MIHALPQLHFKNISREQVLEYFDNGWQMTEMLFSSLQSEEAFIRPPAHGLRHPLIFYYAHPAVLYVNKMRVAGLLQEPVHAYFENIFEVGVDEMSWDDMSKNEMSWPAVAEVQAYREKVYNIIKKLILEDPRLDPKVSSFMPDTPAWALVMGFEHERIHLETSSVLMRELPIEYLQKPAHWPSRPVEKFDNKSAQWLRLGPGPVTIGKSFEMPSFGWDNEYGQRTMEVDEFEVSPALITNQEYLEFVKDGGYREEKFWSDEGWKWRSFGNTKSPHFWRTEGPGGLHEYKLRTIFELIDFQSDWPVIVNFHEAQAYCRWRSEKDSGVSPIRLITEAEHHRLRAAVGLTDSYLWNLNLKYGSEVSAYQFSAHGIYDLYGNVWQWCEDDFNPLPGFKTHPYYEDFSTPCFDGRHQMIMGGSFISTGDEAEPFARFHFRPHFFQHAGFRIARHTKRAAKDSAIRNSRKPISQYESDDLLSQYLNLHFDQTPENVSLAPELKSALGFPQRCAEKLIAYAKIQGVPLRSALDLGCAVGGSSFELSTAFQKVVGVDLSSSFIQTAQALKSDGQISFSRRDQGDIFTPRRVFRPPTSRPDLIEFRQGDAGNLDADLQNFDAVLMANLLCRLPNPKQALENLVGNSVLAPRGLLVLVSPYSWLAQHTPKEQWLGGGQNNMDSVQTIKSLLKMHFDLISEEELPLVIREHERKFQYIVSHLMVWQRK